MLLWFPLKLTNRREIWCLHLFLHPLELAANRWFVGWGAQGVHITRRKMHFNRRVKHLSMQSFCYCGLFLLKRGGHIVEYLGQILGFILELENAVHAVSEVKGSRSFRAGYQWTMTWLSSRLWVWPTPVVRPFLGSLYVRLGSVTLMTHLYWRWNLRHLAKSNLRSVSTVQN